MLRSNRTAPLEILIVDDDKVVALLHKNQLKSSKVEPAPVICSNGREALNYLLKHDSPCKHFLILLDINMPIVDGWKFLENLKKNPIKGKVHVVMATSSINQEDYIKANSYPSVIHFCRKPLTVACVSHIKNLPQLRVFFREEPKGAKGPGK